MRDAEHDAELLLLETAGFSKTDLFLRRREPAEESLVHTYDSGIRRRAEGEPLQYILGTQGFMDFELLVNESVLIPRQETELLVEKAVVIGKTMIDGRGGKKELFRILDLCCGSGAIGISMAVYLPGAVVTAGDVSAAALDVARENARRCGVVDRMRFVQSDMFHAINGEKVSVEKTQSSKLPGEDSGKPDATAKYDMILSNPPYIPSRVIPTLQTEVKDHEPVEALDGGEDGLDFYRILADEAADYMVRDGFLLMEIGHDQGKAVSRLFQETGRYGKIQVYQDLQGNDRMVSCQKTDSCF